MHLFVELIYAGMNGLFFDDITLQHFLKAVDQKNSSKDIWRVFVDLVISFSDTILVNYDIMLN